VRQLTTPTFVAQRARFGLRFTCEHCTYFDETEQRCTHGYPNAEHREARYRGDTDRGAGDPPARAEATLLFCKEFELL
jgi:hypothetical protein